VAIHGILRRGSNDLRPSKAWSIFTRYSAPQKIMNDDNGMRWKGLVSCQYVSVEWIRKYSDDNSPNNPDDELCGLQRISPVI
jgi:hypothetical protein